MTVLFDLSPGTRVTVYEAPAPDGRGAVLVPPGEPYEAICAREPRCRAVGAFAWGDDAVVDLVSGDVEVVRETPRTDPARPAPFPARDFADDHPLPRVRVGVGGGYGIWTNLELACDQEGTPPQQTCDVADSRPLFQGVVEYSPLRALGLGLEVSYTPGLRVEQTFTRTGDPLDAVGHAVDLDVLTLGAFGSTGIQIGPESRLFAALGFLWALNQGDAVTEYESPNRLARESRSEGGGRLAARVGIDWWAPGHRWGFRVEGGGMSGQSDDLDMQWMGAAKVLISLEPR
ncbi:MAG TPA: hypothetical protein VM778_03515 [Gemmatimonadota bacterium]|nr:hypothetical protein [Gemmatimonadota bacterium]